MTIWKLPVYLLFFFLFSPVSGQVLEKPNVVLILVDDMGYESVGCNGSLSYSTPNIDKLAEQGVRFTNCYSQPLCTPSRVKIMTGKYNFRNYEDFGYLNPKEKTIGNLMKDAGYKTCISGKWQLNGLNRNNKNNQDINRPYEFGFDEYCLWQLHHARSEGERYANPLITKNGRDLPRDPDLYGPDIFCEFVLDFINKNSSKPFFVYYPMVLVHDPFVPTPDSKSWKEETLRYNNDTTYFKDMVAYTDKIVQKIVSKLKEKGIWDNTLFIFTADNGTHRSIISRTASANVKGGKGLSINTGNHVPMIVTWPQGNSRKGEYHGIIGFEDFFPTLINITGLSADKPNVDGTSFLQAIKGSQEPLKQQLFIHYSPRWGSFEHSRWVMNEKYKLYRDSRFYNTLDDPNEMHVLTELSAEEEAIRKSFKKIMDDKESKFPFEKNNEKFIGY